MEKWSNLFAWAENIFGWRELFSLGRFGKMSLLLSVRLTCTSIFMKFWSWQQGLMSRYERLRPPVARVCLVSFSMSRPWLTTNSLNWVGLPELQRVWLFSTPCMHLEHFSRNQHNNAVDASVQERIMGITYAVPANKLPRWTAFSIIFVFTLEYFFTSYG